MSREACNPRPPPSVRRRVVGRHSLAVYWRAVNEIRHPAGHQVLPVPIHCNARAHRWQIRRERPTAMATAGGCPAFDPQHSHHTNANSRYGGCYEGEGSFAVGGTRAAGRPRLHICRLPDCESNSACDSGVEIQQPARPLGIGDDQAVVASLFASVGRAPARVFGLARPALLQQG